MTAAVGAGTRSAVTIVDFLRRRSPKEAANGRQQAIAALHWYQEFSWNWSKRERVLCVESISVGFCPLHEREYFG
ncbi:hypothetical protein [Candidatus Accumulibacter sp. ACC007]|uniref:hypothetical protein n=1 Tax=Candidatus Accumulibacter sp. ACC007 TaxID=2823333 RepID=UPI0025BEBC04|nr:hypothetical protein [Candidatus Accumulibacter sp. ACC007]